MQVNSDRQQPVLLRRPEVCRLLGIGPSTLKALIGRGVLREIAIGARGRRVPYSEVERYVAERLGSTRVRS
jgi:excisionase family DNA binding protein